MDTKQNPMARITAAVGPAGDNPSENSVAEAVEVLSRTARDHSDKLAELQPMAMELLAALKALKTAAEEYCQGPAEDMNHPLGQACEAAFLAIERAEGR